MPNFNSENPGTWFYFDPDDESQGGICLRELSTCEHDRIERLTVRKKKKFKRGVPYDDVQTDEKLASKLRWDFCIVDWKGVNLDGRELECNSENKVKMVEVTDFVKFIIDPLIELSDSNASLREAQLKNSESSADGNLKE